MYEVAVTTTFEATHALRMYDGEYEPVHSHDWRVRSRFVGPELDEIGVLVDFEYVVARLRAITDPLAGTHLNEWSALRGRAPSAEHVARAFFELLSADATLARSLYSVTVTEAAGCDATYIGKDSIIGGSNAGGLTIKP
jgi:6-pyruvoyltetrahydropterin/6-carboxytetrahydropterin synthase